jgi:hypothetical protein
MSREIQIIENDNNSTKDCDKEIDITLRSRDDMNDANSDTSNSKTLNSYFSDGSYKTNKFDQYLKQFRGIKDDYFLFIHKMIIICTNKIIF